MKRHFLLILILLSFCLFSCRQNKTERIHQHILKANEYIHYSNFDAAIEELDKCERLDNQNPTIFFLKGNIHTSRRQYEQAIAMYDAAIALDEYFMDAYINRGRVWFYLGNAVKRCEDFLKAESLGATNLKEDTKFCW
jgi:tetratricopeptide (TPR) repeat protein